LKFAKLVTVPVANVRVECDSSNLTAMQQVLEAYRAMRPAREVIKLIKTQFAEQHRWASLEVQVRVVSVRKIDIRMAHRLGRSANAGACRVK
jgi:hypothetical protein